MNRTTFATIAAALCLVAGSPVARAADAQPPADPSQPSTAVRVGGSPADAKFRDDQQKIAATYRRARDACRKRPAAERTACMRTARDQLDRSQAQAKAAQDAGNRTPR